MTDQQEKTQDTTQQGGAAGPGHPNAVGIGPRNESNTRQLATFDGPPAVSTREAYAVFMAPLYAALARAQLAFTPLERDREVEVQPKQRPDGSYPKTYTFDYATLSSVHASTRRALNENGLAITGELSTLDNGAWRLSVELVHESGASKKSSCVFPRDEWQGVGKAVTYARRYIEQTMLGVAADYDDDANAADGHSVTSASARQPDRNQRQQPRPPTNQRPPQQERPKQQETKPAPSETKPAEPEAPPAEPEKRPSNAPPPLPTDEEKAAMKSIEDKLLKEGQPIPEFAELLNKARLMLVKAQISARLKQILPELSKPILGERCRRATGKDPKDIDLAEAKAWLAAELKATA